MELIAGGLAGLTLAYGHFAIFAVVAGEKREAFRWAAIAATAGALSILVLLADFAVYATRQGA